MVSRWITCKEKNCFHILITIGIMYKCFRTTQLFHRYEYEYIMKKNIKFKIAVLDLVYDWNDNNILDLSRLKVY